MTDQNSDARFTSAFKDLEPYINDLVRSCDLALYVSRAEILEEEKISDDGCASIITLEDLQRRVKDLKTLYYEHYRSARHARRRAGLCWLGVTIIQTLSLSLKDRATASNHSNITERHF
jgi:hypothetical protein